MFLLSFALVSQRGLSLRSPSDLTVSVEDANGPKRRSGATTDLAARAVFGPSDLTYNHPAVFSTHLGAEGPWRIRSVLQGCRLL